MKQGLCPLSLLTLLDIYIFRQDREYNKNRTYKKRIHGLGIKPNEYIL